MGGSSSDLRESDKTDMQIKRKLKKEIRYFGYMQETFVLTRTIMRLRTDKAAKF